MKRGGKDAVTTTDGETLDWACDPFKNLFDYNSVIENARERYEAGEPANYKLTEKRKPVVKEDYDGVPF
jgi:hypothetical protein